MMSLLIVLVSSVSTKPARSTLLMIITPIIARVLMRANPPQPTPFVGGDARFGAAFQFPL
jgi:hypothetical protein